MSNRLFKENREKLFSMKNYRYMKSVKNTDTEEHKSLICKKCGADMPVEDWKNNYYVCTKCGYHYPVNAYARLKMLMDEGTFMEKNSEILSTDPLKFPGYLKKLKEVREKTNINDALVTGIGKIDDQWAVVAVLDSTFFMGSMGTVVGEKLVLAIEDAENHQLPLIVFSASGGARMQEGLFSLMQMAKTSAAIAKFGENGGLFISYMTHPTTGGVSASFASLGDIIIAEPEALIGFAGPRVIEQTIGQTLPEGFQRAEFQVDHGFVDMIVERKDMKSTLSKLLRLHAKQEV